MKAGVPSNPHRPATRRSDNSSVGILRGIRFRLMLFVLLLIAVTTFCISFIVMQIMDHVLLESLIQRGSSITQAAAVPAGYSLLTDDRLALDNLAAQIKHSQTELEYVAILDLDQNILAHDQLDRVDSRLPRLAGTLLPHPAGLTIVQGLHQGFSCFEFRRPIFFADQHVGNVVVGLSAREMLASKAAAHRQILIIAALITVLALVGAMLISSIFTRPIEHLAVGVARLQTDEQIDDLPVRSSNELGMLTHSFNQMARTIQQQKTSLQGYAEDLESSYSDMVRILAAALDARDNYTYGHSARVALLALGLAEKLAFTREQLKELELACLLHDIGKIHVSDAILNKQARLNQQELVEMSRHPVLGSQILELTPSLRAYIPAVKHHHERFDGTGYPDRLNSDEIPLHAQIIALADTYDAMTSSRPYRQGLNRAAAIDEIRRGSGSQFSPDLVELFIEVIIAAPEQTTNNLIPQQYGYLCAS